jgi:hypothetical protein
MADFSQPTANADRGRICEEDLPGSERRFIMHVDEISCISMPIYSNGDLKSSILEADT